MSDARCPWGVGCDRTAGPACAALALVALLLAAILFLPACSTVLLADPERPRAHAPRDGSFSEAAAPSPDELWRARVRTEGARLWGLQCGRCHNLRSAATCSVPGQCEICVTHMRVRAYLTGEEARLIAAYLELTRPR